jgi:putative flippase GtrA
VSLFKSLQSKGWRFLLAGGVNSLFGWAMYSLGIVLGAPIWLALIIGAAAGVAFNFLTIGGYVFKDLSAGKLPRFILAYVVVYGVNLTALTLLKPLLVNPVWAQLVLTPLVAALSFVLMSQWVFAPTRG